MYAARVVDVELTCSIFWPTDVVRHDSPIFLCCGVLFKYAAGLFIYMYGVVVHVVFLLSATFSCFLLDTVWTWTAKHLLLI